MKINIMLVESLNYLNSKHFPNLMTNCLATLHHVDRAQCGYENSLKETYIPIAGDFQEPLSMMSHTFLKNKTILNLVPKIKIKFRLEILTHDVSII